MFRRDGSEDFNSAITAAFSSVLCSPTLFGHFGSEAVLVDIVAAFERDFASEFERETMRIVQKECDRAADSCARTETIEFCVEQRRA